MNYTHALVCTVDNIPAFPVSRGVRLFESAVAANEYAVAQLVECNQLKAVKGGWIATAGDNSSEVYPTAAEALNEFQWQLESTEYFHVLEIQQA